MKQDLRRFLQQVGVDFEERSVENGVQFRCNGGEKFTVYTTGKVVSGGAKSDLTEQPGHHRTQ